MDGMTKSKAAHGEGYLIAPDGVHPSPNGHLAMAYAFLKALGVSGDIGTLTIDYTGNRAIGTAGHKVTGYKAGILDVESTRYPFCFSGKIDGTDTLAMSAFLPFNEELNRFRLVVQRAPARSLVTWGATTKEFTAAQLAAGINLAAEFPENPFVEPFNAATAKMKEQQAFETVGIKGVLNAIGGWRRLMPEGVEHYDGLRSIVTTKSETLRAASRAAVKPVTYQITIQPAS